MRQQSALNILKSGKNVFLTGSAGSGKTHLVNHYIDYLRARDARVAVTASTGISATHIGGRTIHSWSGLGIRDELNDNDLDNIAKKKPVRARIAKARVLIIDEISMLSAKTLTCVDEILRHIKRNPSPFGGIQVVFSGDFFQLPPVVREAVPAHEKMAFTAPAWERANLEICYLSESHRHGDDILLRLLNEIRSGDVSSDCRAMLAKNLQRGGDESDESTVKLHTHNVDVDAANARKLERLPGEEKRFDASTAGAIQAAVDALKKTVMAPECLHLKKDAQVMFVKNAPEENYMNGTLGRVVDFSDKGLPVVETFAGERVTAYPAEWNVLNEQGEVMASYIQVPLRLAWAVTVHKSQGMTLDRVAVDLSKTFEPGQGYVALSRVKTWDGLQLMGYNLKALQVDSLVLKMDCLFRELSVQAEQKIVTLSDHKLHQIFANHIIKCGGKNDVKESKRHIAPASKERVTEAPNRAKTHSYMQTKVLVEQGKTLSEIAIERNCSEKTIIAHLAKIHVNYPELDMSNCKPDDSMLADVRVAMDTCKQDGTGYLDKEGNLKYGTVYLYRALDKKYTYNQIKLAVIFCGDNTVAGEAKQDEKLQTGSKEWLAMIKEKHPRAYESWDADEDELLKKRVTDGMTLKDIAFAHNRRLGAIRSRIKKLGI